MMILQSHLKTRLAGGMTSGIRRSATRISSSDVRASTGRPETLPPAERLRKRGFAIEHVDATEDLPVVDLLVFLRVDSVP